MKEIFTMLFLIQSITNSNSNMRDVLFKEDLFIKLVEYLD